jgi:cobalamin biosynthesis protein CbiG
MTRFPRTLTHVYGGSQLKNLLYEFQSMASTDAKFEPTIKELYAKLAQHIREEEQEDLPALEKAIPVGDSDAMALSFERTKMLVPTRSHPSAPDKPVSVGVRCSALILRLDSAAVRDCCGAAYCTNGQDHGPVPQISVSVLAL